MFVKICGVRTVETVNACREAGADAVGFNFWPGSPRAITPERAHTLASHCGPMQRWGVFVNPSAADVEQAFSQGIIDVAQLHGQESPEFCDALGRQFVKALRITTHVDLLELERYHCAHFLVDGPRAGSGVTGNLELAQRAAQKYSIVLAGGLTSENVASAIAQVQPFGVDVASGVESAPGVKDPALIARFVAAAKAVS